MNHKKAIFLLVFSCLLLTTTVTTSNSIPDPKCTVTNLDGRVQCFLSGAPLDCDRVWEDGKDRVLALNNLSITLLEGQNNAVCFLTCPDTKFFRLEVPCATDEVAHPGIRDHTTTIAGPNVIVPTKNREDAGNYSTGLTWLGIGLGILVLAALVVFFIWKWMKNRRENIANSMVCYSRGARGDPDDV